MLQQIREDPGTFQPIILQKQVLARCADTSDVPGEGQLCNENSCPYNVNVVTLEIYRQIGSSASHLRRCSRAARRLPVSRDLVSSPAWSPCLTRTRCVVRKRQSQSTMVNKYMWAMVADYFIYIYIYCMGHLLRNIDVCVHWWQFFPKRKFGQLLPMESLYTALTKSVHTV